MPRLIDADVVVTIQTYDDMYEEWRAETITVAEAMDKFSDEGCPPTIDAEPVRHGEWENYPSHAYRRCSVCKMEWEKPRFNVRSNYCPNCGAKMDGGR